MSAGNKNHLMIFEPTLFHNAGDRTRTCVGTKPTALEAVPFDHSGTPAS